MREGAWINATTGDYCWVDDHAGWILRPGNAAALGLPDILFVLLNQRLQGVAESNRKAILLAVMGIGLIRARGHGNDATFESILPVDQSVQGALRFMDENFGPAMLCRFNDLLTGNSAEFFFDQARKHLSRRAQ